MFAQIPSQSDSFMDQHSGEVLILALSLVVVVTLIIVVPQLLRANLRKGEWTHLEHMRALEEGQELPPPDEASRAAGRCAMLVPMVAIITVGTVTCFLVAYKVENIFGVALAVWTVAGIVSLAAITGGVALIGRIAQLQTGEEEDSLQMQDEPPHHGP